MSIRDRIYRSKARTAELEKQAAEQNRRTISYFRAYWCQDTADQHPHRVKTYASPDGSTIKATHLTRGMAAPTPEARFIGTILDSKPIPDAPKAVTTADLQHVTSAVRGVADLAAQNAYTARKLAEAPRTAPKVTEQLVYADLNIEGGKFTISWRGKADRLDSFVRNLGFRAEEFETTGGANLATVVPVEGHSYTLVPKKVTVRSPDGSSQQVDPWHGLKVAPAPPSMNTRSRQFVDVSGRVMTETQIRKAVKALYDDVTFDIDPDFERWQVKDLGPTLKNTATRAGFSASDWVYTYEDGGEALLGRCTEVNFALHGKYDDTNRL